MGSNRQHKKFSPANQVAADKVRLRSEREKFEREKSDRNIWLEKQKQQLEIQKQDIASAREKISQEVETLMSRESELEVQYTAIGDFMHEQRKFNEKMNNSMEELKKACNVLKDSPYDKASQNLLLNTSKSVFALSRMSNMRMEMLEYFIIPNIFNRMKTTDIYIYREVEKIYKSINNGIGTERDKFDLRGKSFGRYNTQRMLTIALFSILENASKYSPLGDKVIIEFTESKNTLEVTITNLGPKVNPEEKEHLTDRKFRSTNAKIALKDKGSGLGLSIAKQVFEACGVEFKIDISGATQKTISRVEYAPFVVKLKFYPIDIPANLD